MKTLKLLSVLALGAFAAGCADFDDDSKTQTTGSADFSKYYAVGNSITAGYQSNALFEAGQLKSYPKMIATQIGTNFAIPTVSGDGLGGRIKWSGAFVGTSPAFTYAASQAGAPSNQAYYVATGNYNNLGIPGMITVIPGTSALGHATDFFDVNVNNTGSDALVGPGGVGGSRKNPLFNVVLLNGARGTNIADALTAQQPTFVSLWLGNNDVLGYATSGGTNPSAPTDETVFETKYAAILDHVLNLASAPKVAVATIPNVVTIPFFTTVNPGLASSLPSGLSLRFQKSTESTAVGSGTATAAELRSYKHMVTLLASSYLGKLGQPYGGWIKRLADSQGLTVDQFYAAVLAPAGVDTTQAFGLHPQNPLPNYLILDEDEIVVAATAVAKLNAKIKSVAAASSRASRVAVVDVSTEFTRVANATAAGSSVAFQGISVTTAFITGGLFSYDGVHPSDLGHGVIANMFIQSINAKYGASIKEVQLQGLAGARFGKAAPTSRLDVVMPEGSLDNMLRAVGAF